MKRLFSLILLIALTAALAAGCSQETAAPAADPADAAAASEPAEASQTEEPAAAEDAPTVDEQIALVQSLIDEPVDQLYEAIGYPEDTAYASSCLGPGEDGEFYYDGFTVYTYRDPDGNEVVYDVMAAAAES